MCMVTLLPCGYTDNKWFTQKTSHLHAIYHQMICPTQISFTLQVGKQLYKFMDQVVHQLYFGCFLSPYENNFHVQVLDITQHCRGVV